MIDLLLEKYIGTILSQYEVFVNPSKREIRDTIEASGGYGYRFLINFKAKTFYIFPADTYHKYFFEEIAKTLKGNERLPSWTGYWVGKQGNDYLFSGHTDSSGRIDSDFFMQRREQRDIEDLINQDWSWVKKYIDIDATRNILIDYSGIDMDLFG